MDSRKASVRKERKSCAFRCEGRTDSVLSRESVRTGNRDCCICSFRFLCARADSDSSAAGISEDLSVIGFDDIPLCERICPPLTTVRQDRSARAKLAVRKLEELKAGENVELTVRLPVELAVRESVKRQENAERQEMTEQ